MNVLTSITVLGFLIFFHEMGHFLAAILQGIYVDGFFNWFWTINNSEKI